MSSEIVNTTSEIPLRSVPEVTEQVGEEGGMSTDKNLKYTSPTSNHNRKYTHICNYSFESSMTVPLARFGV